ncbi:hypothetical protein Lwal_2687 [Legionella waltersii]|uniref:Uncharacterized protein n=1 Tax=Legionella waltersii TaxID=66969 RepID=A0A0W1A020_9GAMM|nr:hypothetical protein Lwal_2687 [Legionella waltersii]SNV08998.1 Uncharacterised protein [Legionella waltersii]
MNLITPLKATPFGEAPDLWYKCPFLKKVSIPQGPSSPLSHERLKQLAESKLHFTLNNQETVCYKNLYHAHYN